MGLRAWHSLAPDVQLTVEDDGSDPGRLQAGIRELAHSSDLLLGPYSTHLMRAAAPAVVETGALLWNHGSAGDDVQAAWPGRVVSVLTPASRYATPLLRRLADQVIRAQLWIIEGRGSFGRQVADGAEKLARRLGLKVERLRAGDLLPSVEADLPWDLLCAGSFEEDAAMVTEARSLAWPPRTLCAVGAGVSEFGAAVASPDGVYGIAQWVPGQVTAPRLGPAETDFLAAYSRLSGGPPDYLAVQAAAAAVLATHCAQVAGSVEPDPLWSTAARLDTSTLFGVFGIDPTSGLQSKHETVLVRWTGEELAAAE
jgi:ABC-type branched-subunit amino acid transport system substrate-binding protein